MSKDDIYQIRMVSTRRLLMIWLFYWSSASSLVQGFDLSRTLTRETQNFYLNSKGRSSLMPLESGDPNIATRSTASSLSRNEIDENLLQQLENCETGTSARRLLEKALNIDKDNDTNERPLFDSIQITAGLSDKTISDGDLAIQTKVRNKKYGIFDLIDMNGDRDADRISAAVFGVFLASSLSAIAVNENLPGPEILRFTVVWLLSFAPL